MQSRDVLEAIDTLASGRVLESMQRFGIPTDNARGVNTPALKAIARKIGHDHQLAQKLITTFFPL